MVSCSETGAVVFWGWDHAGVYILVNNVPPPVREGVVLGDWSCGGLVEGVCSSVELLLEK